MISVRRAMVVGVLVYGALGIGVLHADAPPAPPSTPPVAMKFPHDVTLTRVLGFRTDPGLGESYVHAHRNYLGVGDHLRLLDAKPAFGTKGSFCRAENGGKTGYIRCDDPSAFKIAAAGGGGGGGGGSHAKYQSFCGNTGTEAERTADCMSFCSANCTFDPHKWTSSGALATSCHFSQDIITRAGGPAADQLQSIPNLTYVKGNGATATIATIENLKKVNDAIAANASWPKGHVVAVNSCYRPVESEATNECDHIMKGIHLRKKWAGKTPANDKERATMKSELALADQSVNPPRYLGLTWPGPSPHSWGFACDLIVVDERGGHSKKVTACAGSAGDTTMKNYSKILDEIVTGPSVGAVRLNYEMWHYEWGGVFQGCRCKAPECNDKHWPPPCDGPQHC